jgi:hypothetical protein
MSQLSESSGYSVIRFRDRDGRPLGEGKLSTLLAGVPMVLTRCPYPGSRYAHAQPMNLSALQQIRAHWDECRTLLAWAHRIQNRSRGANHATLSDVWRTARLAQSLPGWLLLRRHDPVADGALPPAVAGAFKIVIGFTHALQRLHLDAALTERYDAQEPIVAETLLDRIEEHGLLIGPTQVCAAPHAMIREAITLLINGNAGATLDPTLAATIGGDMGPGRYGAQSMRFQAACAIVELLIRALTIAVLRIAASANAGSKRLHDATDHLTSGLADVPLRHAAGLPPDRLVALADSVRGFMTGPQRDDSPMGAAIVEAIDAFRRPRRDAESKLAAFTTERDPVMPPEKLSPLLARLLALERAWLRLNGLGEAGLETCLGRVAAPRTIAELDGLLGRTALRAWFEAAFDLRITQHEHEARLASGAAELTLPAALL